MFQGFAQDARRGSKGRVKILQSLLIGFQAQALAGDGYGSIGVRIDSWDFAAVEWESAYALQATHPERVWSCQKWDRLQEDSYQD